MKIRNKQQGFTIVELLIVIIVIGILVGLVITTFTGIQQKGRNTERQTDIKAIHGQLEAYFAQEGRYPELNDLNSASWRGDKMKGLDKDALYDPRDVRAQTTKDSTPLVDTPAVDVYSYEVVHKPSTGPDVACSNAEGSTTECNKYVLTAKQEGTTDYVKNSLN